MMYEEINMGGPEAPAGGLDNLYQNVDRKENDVPLSWLNRLLPSTEPMKNVDWQNTFGRVFFLDDHGVFRPIDLERVLAGEMTHFNQLTGLPYNVGEILQQFTSLPLTRIHHYANNGEYLKALFNERKLVDVIIHIQDKVYAAHRVVLACHSVYFARVFILNQSHQKHLTEIRLKNIDRRAFFTALRFIYTGQIFINNTNVEGLMTVAKQLQIPAVMFKCLDFLGHMPSTRDLEVVGEPKLHVILQQAQKMLTEHLREITQKDSFLEMGIETVEMVLGDDNLLVDREMEVFYAAMSWLTYDLGPRRKYLERLMAKVRFTSMTPAEVINTTLVNNLIRSSPYCRNRVMEAIWIMTIRSYGTFDALRCQIPNPRTCLLGTEPEPVEAANMYENPQEQFEVAMEEPTFEVAVEIPESTEVTEQQVEDTMRRESLPEHFESLAPEDIIYENTETRSDLYVNVFEEEDYQLPEELPEEIAPQLPEELPEEIAPQLPEELPEEVAPQSPVLETVSDQNISPAEEENIPPQPEDLGTRQKSEEKVLSTEIQEEHQLPSDVLEKTASDQNILPVKKEEKPQTTRIEKVEETMVEEIYQLPVRIPSETPTPTVPDISVANATTQTSIPDSPANATTQTSIPDSPANATTQTSIPDSPANATTQTSIPDSPTPVSEQQAPQPQLPELRSSPVSEVAVPSPASPSSTRASTPATVSKVPSTPSPPIVAPPPPEAEVPLSQPDQEMPFFKFYSSQFQGESLMGNVTGAEINFRRQRTSSSPRKRRYRGQESKKSDGKSKNLQPAGASSPLVSESSLGGAGDILAIGGYLDWEHKKGCSQAQRLVSGQNSSWERYAVMPETRIHFTAVCLKGRLYIIGGYDPKTDSRATRDTFRYSLANKKWSRGGSMLQARSFHALCSVNGRLYALGGQDEKERALDTAEVYDPVADKWSAISCMSYCRVGASSVAYKEGLIVVGGYGDSGDTGWESCCLLRIPRAQACLVQVDNCLYLCAGATRNVCTGVLCSIRDVDMYDPDTDQWTHLTDLQTARHNAGATVSGSKIYIVGGVSTDTNQVLRSVECYDTVSKQWDSSLPDLPIGAKSLACTVITSPQE